MNRMPRRIAAMLTALILLPATANAQGTPPRLTHVSPLGGQKGSTLEVTLTGQSLDGVESLHFSIPGVKAESLGSEKVDPKIDPKAKGKGPTGPLTSHKFRITLPGDAPLGIHDVRLITKGGVTNPRAFVVGDLPEALEKEGNDDVPQAQKIPLNSSVSGVVSAPTDVDYFQFAGKKGQRVVVSCLSSSVDSKLPAEIQLVNDAGRLFGISRGYWQNDALLDATLPEDGAYLVRLCSFTYTQGGPDYFYRLTVSTAPWIDAVQPAAVEAGKETTVTVWGRNLPGGVADPSTVVDGRVLEKAEISVKPDAAKAHRLDYSGTILPPSAAIDGMELRVKNETGSSNPFLLTIARSAVVTDAGGNDSQDKAQKVTVPCEVSGRIEKSGDKDWYSFELKKGQTIVVEAFGDRLGSSLDLFFQMRDDKGKPLPEQDDNPDITNNAFFTRNDDPPPYRFTAPGDGTYSLMITSREAFSLSGPRQFYVLRLRPEDPDFHLVAMPSLLTPEGLTLGQGGHQAMSVFVFREGGFNGEIALAAEGLPAGVSMLPQKIGMNQKTGAFVIGAAPEAPPAAGAFKVIGTATIGGKKVVREVRPATITWPGVQPNIALISRLDREMVVAVRGQAPYAIAAEKASLNFLQGEKITIPVKFTAIKADFKTPVQVVALNAPPGLVSQPLTLSIDKKTGTLSLDTKMPTPPGVYTVVLRGQTAPLGKAPPPKGPTGPNFVEVTPPLTITIVPKQLAKFVVEKMPKLAPGKAGEVVVKIDRQFDFNGPFKIEVATAKGTFKVSAEDVKEGQDELHIRLEPPGDTKSGTSLQFNLRATAIFGDVPVVHEIKGISVTVTK